MVYKQRLLYSIWRRVTHAQDYYNFKETVLREYIGEDEKMTT
jgi:hypothetical protein